MELNLVEISLIENMLSTIEGMAKRVLGMDVRISVREGESEITVTGENGDTYTIYRNAETENEHRYYLRSDADA